MAFSISSVTDAGRTAMQIALDNDYPLIFTALRSGNGSYTEGEDVTSRTALKSLKNSFSIGSREDLEHSVKLGAVLTNYDGTSTIVSESYNVNEIGLFCTVNNIEYLYALAAAPDDSGRELPAYDGTNLTQIVQTWTVALTNDAEIQVEMSGAYALAADLTTEIANRKVADSKDNTVTYTSADDVSIFNSGDLGGDSDYAWAPVAKIDSAEKHSVLFNKVSTMFKNIRTIAKLIGTTDISAVGDGTVSGAIGTLSSDLSEKVSTSKLSSLALLLNKNGSLPVKNGSVVYAASDIDTGIDTIRIEVNIGSNEFTLKIGRTAIGYYINGTKIWVK